MTLFKYSKREGAQAYWYARGKYPDGTQYFISSGIKVTGRGRKTAELEAWYEGINQRWREKQGGERINGVYDPTKMVPNLENLEKLFWERLEGKNRDPETLRRYKINWNVLRAHFDTVESFSHPVLLQRFVAKRLSESSKPPSIKKDLDVLLGIYNYALKQGMKLPPTPAWPDLNMRSHQPGRRRGHYVKEDVVQEFYKRLANRGVRNEAADRFLLCFLTGLRWGESNRLDIASVTIPIIEVPGLARIVTVLGKNKRWRDIPLGQQGWAAWQRSVPFQTKTNNTLYENVSKEMGLNKPLTLRDLRATFATQLADLVIPQASINLVMGHGASKMEMKYQQAHAERLGKISEAIERLIIPQRLWTVCGQPNNALQKMP